MATPAPGAVTRVSRAHRGSQCYDEEVRCALLLALALGSFTMMACDATLQNQLCHRSWRIAHPTMTPEEISIGSDARVRQVSEGSKGALPGGATSRVD